MNAEHELQSLFLSHEDLEQALEDVDALIESASSHRIPEEAEVLANALDDLRRRIEDHMTAEERWVFPEVLRAGAPIPLIAALTATHARVRELGDGLDAEPHDPERARKWLRAFREHVGYEERALSHWLRRAN